MRVNLVPLAILTVIAWCIAIFCFGCATMPAIPEQLPPPPAKHQLENVANWGIYGGAALAAASLVGFVLLSGFRKYCIGGIIAGAGILVASTWLAVFIPILLKTLMYASVVILILIGIGCIYGIIRMVQNWQRIKKKYPKIWATIKPEMSQHGKVTSTMVSLIKGK